MKDYEVNVTVKELEDCLKFAKDNGMSAIRLHYGQSNGVGTSLAVSRVGDDQGLDFLDITDVGSW